MNRSTSGTVAPYEQGSFHTMESTNRNAFKEWAAVCEAVASGRQTILVRKGGIHERRGDFTLEHREFWLFPTRFHEGAEDLTQEGQQFLIRAGEKVPAMGMILFSTYFEVTDVVEIASETELPKLRPYHIYADHVLEQRFHYKRLGLTVLVGRASVLAEPTVIPDSPHFGGCRSWVDLPAGLVTRGLAPVLPEEVFASRRREILLTVQPRAIL